jgi:hypothetical protein
MGYGFSEARMSTKTTLTLVLASALQASAIVFLVAGWYLAAAVMEVIAIGCSVAARRQIRATQADGSNGLLLK